MFDGGLLFRLYIDYHQLPYQVWISRADNSKSQWQIFSAEKLDGRHCDHKNKPLIGTTIPGISY